MGVQIPCGKSGPEELAFDRVWDSLREKWTRGILVFDGVWDSLREKWTRGIGYSMGFKFPAGNGNCGEGVAWNHTRMSAKVDAVTNDSSVATRPFDKLLWTLVLYCRAGKRPDDDLLAARNFISSQQSQLQQWNRVTDNVDATRNESVPIQPAQCRYNRHSAGFFGWPFPMLKC